MEGSGSDCALIRELLGDEIERRHSGTSERDAFAAFLARDLSEHPGRRVFPERMQGVTVLSGTHAVQVQSAVDIWQADEQRKKAEPSTSSHRCLKMELTDGHKSVVAVEHTRCGSLIGIPLMGTKLVLRDVPVHREILMLRGENANVLWSPVKIEPTNPEEEKSESKKATGDGKGTRLAKRPSPYSSLSLKRTRQKAVAPNVKEEGTASSRKRLEPQRNRLSTQSANLSPILQTRPPVLSSSSSSSSRKPLKPDPVQWNAKKEVMRPEDEFYQAQMETCDEKYEADEEAEALMGFDDSFSNKPLRTRRSKPANNKKVQLESSKRSPRNLRHPETVEPDRGKREADSEKHQNLLSAPKASSQPKERQWTDSQERKSVGSRSGLASLRLDTPSGSQESSIFEPYTYISQLERALKARSTVKIKAFTWSIKSEVSTMLHPRLILMDGTGKIEAGLSDEVFQDLLKVDRGYLSSCTPQGQANIVGNELGNLLRKLSEVMSIRRVKNSELYEITEIHRKSPLELVAELKRRIESLLGPSRGYSSPQKRRYQKQRTGITPNNSGLLEASDGEGCFET